MKERRQHTFCPYCGGAISPMNATCPHCGADLSGLESHYEETMFPGISFREVIQRILGTFYKPDAIFMEISQFPEFKGPLLVISILTLVALVQTIILFRMFEPIQYTLTLIISSYLLQILLPTMPSIIQQILLISTVNSTLSLILPLSIASTVLEFILLWPVFGSLYWGFSKILGGKGNFKSTLIILGYAGTPQIIGLAATLILNNIILTTIIFDITLLWTGILIGYGLSSIHKIPKNKSLIIGLIIPVILVILSLLYGITVPQP